MKLEVDVTPSIVMPNKDFLIGAIFGINVMRRPPETNPPNPTVPAETAKLSEPLMGHWLEVNCERCKRFYGFDHPNDVPAKTLVCDTPGCGNHIIIYGVPEPKDWRLGPIVFVK